MNDITIPRREAENLSVPGARHGFFGRQGGVSTGIYASLNCGQGSNDDPQAIEANRSRIVDALGCAGGTLLTPWQVHGISALIVSAAWPAGGERPRADALVTNTPGLVLGVLTADCAPILFIDPDARIVGAAHAGWRGALAGIVEATVAAMESIGARRRNIRAAIGPCLSVANYEIGPEFRASFLAADAGHERFFRIMANGSSHFDLPAFVHDRLHRCELDQTTDLAVCTYAQTESYFSYRRTTHQKAADYGRQISAIVAV